MATLVQVVSIEPAQAVAGDTGPMPIPGATTALLDGGQWESKNQHRIWWHSDTNRWDAILPTGVGWAIAENVIPATPGATPLYDAVMPGVPDDEDRPDIYWDDASDRLYVLMSGGTNQLHTFDYVGGAYVLDTTSTLPSMAPGEGRAAIYKVPGGNVWASMMDDTGLYVVRSTDDGATWPSPPVRLHLPVAEGQTQLAHFGNQIGVIAAEDGDNDQVSQYLFYRLTENAANWNVNNAATAQLVMNTNPINGVTLTVGAQTYTFTAAAFPVEQTDGLVRIGLTMAETQANLVAAINLDDDFEGTGYAKGMSGNALISAGPFVGNVATMTAREIGPGGNAIPITHSPDLGYFITAPTAGGASSWLREAIPLSSPTGRTHSDDEISLVRNTNGDLYVATETQHPGGNSTEMLAAPQVVVFRRIAATNAWTQHVVKMDDTTSNTDRKRPVVAIQGNVLYVIAIHQNQTESSYKTASLVGDPTPLAFSGGNGTFSAWEPLFNTQFEVFRNNIVPREPTTVGQKLPVLIDWAWDAVGDDNTIWQTSLTNSGNQAPGVFAGEDKVVSITIPTNLNAIVTDLDILTSDNPITFAWTTVGVQPGVVSFSNAASPSSTATFSALGFYVLRLTATETGPNPLSNFDDVIVNVLAVNNPPTISVTNPKNGDTAAAGAPVQFTASAPDPESGDISGDIRWTSSRDGVLPEIGGSFIKSNLSTGTHVITAIVSDGQNTVAAPGVTLTIGAGGPGPGPGPGGGGTAPFAAVQTNSGIWKLYHGATQISSFFYGNPGDHAFMGDWNCDGVKTPGLYRRSDGYVYLRNSNTQGVADIAFFFGNPGDLPMAGDFDNDGCDTVSIYRPAEGRFYIMNHLGAGDAGLGAADFAYFYGNPGDAAFMGDFDGDGIDTPGLRRNSDGFVYLRNSNTQGNGEQVYFYGDSGDVVFTGDWDRDGDDTLGLYRPSTGNVYLRNTNSTGIADATIAVGGGMQAVGGKF